MPVERKSSLNFGAIVFASFSFLSLLVCFVKGIVPIYALEAVIWGALAWFGYKRSPFSQKANLIVLLLAVAVAGVEGYSVGAHSGGKSYTHIQSGGLLYRVDSRSGRTDVLRGVGGWQPISFDRPPKPIDLSGIPLAPIVDFPLTEGRWHNSSEKICFMV